MDRSRPALSLRSGGEARDALGERRLVLVIAVWLAASLLFRGWITTVANFKSATGSLTVFLVLTSYVLVSATIFLVGAEVNELARKRNARS